MDLAAMLGPMLMGASQGQQPGMAQPTTNAQLQLGAYFDPSAMAQLQTDQMDWARRNQLAQSLMTQGYVPHSGKFGMLAGLASMLGGKFAQDKNDTKLSDIVKRQMEVQQQAAAAQRQQQLEDEMRKANIDIAVGTGKARGEAQAKKEFATPEFKDGGVFDPTTGSYTPSQAWTDQQLSLKKAEAAIAAANRQDPNASLMAKLQLAQKMGADPQALLTMVTGNQGAGVPSGYRAAPGGKLEAIPGGPADPATQANKLQPVSAENRTKLGLLDAAQSALDNYKKAGTEGGTPTPLANNFTPGNTANTSMEEAIANMLRVESGAAISAGEISAAKSRYEPSTFRSDAENKNRLEMLDRKLKQMREAITTGTNEALPASGAPATTPSLQDIMAELQRRGVTPGG